MSENQYVKHAEGPQSLDSFETSQRIFAFFRVCQWKAEQKLIVCCGNNHL